MVKKLLLYFFLLVTTRGIAQTCTAPSPNVQGTTVCSNNVATLTVLSAADKYEWFASDTDNVVLSTSNKYTTPPLGQTTVYYVRVTVDTCVSVRVPVTAFVNPVTNPPVVPDVTICSGSNITLSATGPGDTFEWFTVPAGGTRLILSPDYTTPNLTATTTYYVQTTLRGCLSERVPVTVTVNPIPAAPATQSVPPICAGSTATLTATATEGTIQWTNAAGALVGTGPTFTTPVLSSTTTFFANTTNGGCGSARIPATVTVNPTPAAPSAAGAIICNGSSTTLTAFAPGGNYQWYDAANGGNLLASGPTLSTGPLTATRTYYVQTTISSCPGPRSPITVTVNPVAAPPTAPGTAVCSGNTATLTASGSTGSYAWYTSPSGGTAIASTASFTTPALSATTTYYVETTIEGCTSTRTPVTVTVNTPPAAPSAPDQMTCAGTTATMTASAPAGTLEWYDAPSGGTLLFSGPSYQTPPLSAATTYYVQANNGTCTSSRTAVTASLYPVYNPEFRYSRRTYLPTGPNPTPTILNPAGGTFTSSPAGLVINPSTGQIDVSASVSPQSYTVTFTHNGPCPQVSTAVITITNTPAAGFTYDGGPFCQYGTNITPRFSAGATPGAFTASPAGLVFFDPATGEIDLTNSTPGNYRITNTFTNGTTAFFDITINPAPVVNAGTDQAVAAGSIVALSGSVSPAGSVLWTGGAGTFSNKTVINPTYTPGPGETNATLILTYTTPGACPSAPDTVLITFIANPSVADISICYNTTGTLTATGPGEVYRWYDAASGGNLLQTGGASFTSPTLTATTTYYVQSTVSGVTTGRTAATINVASMNGPITANPVTICYANTATLSVSGADSYKWYDASTSGNLLSVSASYTTPVLYANTIYYVEGTANGCTGARVPVNVTVNPLPNVTSGSSTAFCSGSSFSYTITANLPGTTFLWNRAAVPGITTPQGQTDLLNQSSPTISETLISTNITPTVVTYVITPMASGCPGAPFSYRVTVNPVPAASSSSSGSICNNTATNYTVSFNVAGTSFSWSRGAVAGIGNAAISGQHANPIREILVNNTTTPKIVTYTYTSATATCAGTAFSYVVTVNPTVGIVSAKTANICSSVPQNYTIVANNPVTTFSWSRSAAPNISNPVVSGQTTNTISEALVNTGTTPVQVSYTIVPTAYGCTGSTFVYRVTVFPQPATPVITSNSPVCTGSSIQLSTSDVEGGTYAWTGPGAFTSTSRTPVIPGAGQANAGSYRVTVTVNGCMSATGTANVAVTIPPVANAGPDQRVCAATNGIQLNGTISGGTTTGVWTSSGTGMFIPSATTLNAIYVPSAADRLLASLTITLTSTNNANCPPAISTLQVTLQVAPIVQAGADQDECSQTQAVPLNGTIINASISSWSTSGDGSFAPSNASLQVTYIPGKADISKGSAVISLTSAPIGTCGPATDDLLIRFIPPPTVSTGPDRLVLKGKQIVLNASSSDPNVQYLWTPNVQLNDNKVKNPIFTALADQTYTLTITDSRGCVNSDQVFIKVLDPIVIPNTFTPNGDGINDVWNIPALIEYPSPKMTIYTRYGEPVFHTDHYNEPWNGMYKGKPLPVGVYYYVIESNFEGQIYSGYITIIR